MNVVTNVTGFPRATHNMSFLPFAGIARRAFPVRSGQQFFHDLPMDVGEAEVAALEAVGQLGVVEAEQVQERGVQVVDMDLVVGGVEAEIVRSRRASGRA